MKKISTMALVAFALLALGCTHLIQNPKSGERITISDGEGLVAYGYTTNEPAATAIHISPSPLKVGSRRLMWFNPKDGRIRIFKQEGGGQTFSFQMTTSSPLAGTYFLKPIENLFFEVVPGEITYIGHVTVNWDQKNSGVSISVEDREQEMRDELRRLYPELMEKHRFNKKLAVKYLATSF